LGYRSSEFFKNIQSFRTRENFAEIVRNKFGNNFLFLGQKNPVFEVKTGVLGSKTGVSEHSELSKNYEKMTLKLNF
jgi:hypothetical protein